MNGSSSVTTPVFLLGGGEVGMGGSGRELEYFKTTWNIEDSDSHPLLVAKDSSGTARTWWLRDAQKVDWESDDGEDWGTDYVAYAIYTDGRKWSGVVNTSYYVRPCFILNSAFEVSDVCDDDVCYTIGGGSGSSKFYAGDTSAKAQAVKKLYVGDANGVAQKVKKLYVGDANGIARLVYSAHEPNMFSYYGTATSLASARRGVAAASNPKYALFAGGGSSGSSAVDAYNASLVRSTPTSLSISRYDIGTASIGDYAIFAGGTATNEPAYSNVDAYNSSLTRTQKTLSVARFYIQGASVGNYAIFSAGYTDDGEDSGVTSTTDAFNKSLTRTTLSGARARYEHGSVSNGSYAIFGGGSDGDYIYSDVWYWNASLTRSTSYLMVAKGTPKGVRAGNYALFVAGDDADNLETTYDDDIVDIFSSSMTRSVTFLRRKNYTQFYGATTLGKYGILWGSYTVDGWLHAFDDKLTYLSKDMSSISKLAMNAATTIGDYALFGGGMAYENGSTEYLATATVHAFKLI